MEVVLSTTTASIYAPSTETASTDVTTIDVPSTEAISQVTSEASSGAITKTLVDTTDLTTVTAETTADTTTSVTLTTEATADTTTGFTATSTVETTTTSEAPPFITSFFLKAGNSAFTSANGKWVILHQSLAIGIGPPPNLGSQYQVPRFSIEPETNYLMVGDHYVVSPENRANVGLTKSDSGARFIVCMPPMTQVWGLE
ncbi:hypothetical protein NW766_008647 [Fusarium irregulare]|uniref:Uncharacterized protein n=1 Tax=Fusarium irregulare TaxID=2494466 RepID=A0A9W8PK56_9HYPO|nr:hypothetical protein NW766_008647 [Fusarium irregulare]